MVLVTGGTGLVGGHLIARLLLEGQKVRALKRAGSNMKLVETILGQDFHSHLLEWYEGDVLDIYSLMEAMQEVSYVYHAAAVISFQPSDVSNMLKINVEGTANVVNAALTSGVKKLCYVSSIAAIGRALPGESVTEKTPWKASPNNSNYAISKYGAEREVWRGTIEGLDAVIVNPSVIIGPGDWNSGSSKMFKKAYEGLRFYTDGINGFVDVRDVCSSMILLMKSDIKNERFIVSSGNISFRDFFDQVCEAFGKPRPSIKAGRWLAGFTWRFEALRSFFTGSRPLITKETARSASQCYFYSSEKMIKATGFSFISISDSIKDTCAIFTSRLLR
jgi:dihydroflavonol-4-reductase